MRPLVITSSILNKIYSIWSKKIIIVFLLFGLSFSITDLFGHGVQIGYCQLANGNLRVYIEHWHDNSTNAPLSVTITSAGVTTTQTYNATGYYHDTPLNGLPGCGANMVILEACANEANTYGDWLYWDFSAASCANDFTITIDAGLSQVTEEACPELYPQTISAGPMIACEDIMVNSCVAEKVTYDFPVSDICDPNVTVTYDIPSGSEFPQGSTTVIASATDIYGRTGTCSFNVIVMEINDLDGDGHSAINACSGTMDDCDDNNPFIYPGAPELCDGLDNNCDGDIETATVYNIPLTDFYNFYDWCGPQSYYTYYDFGFTWMSTGSVTPTSVSIEFVVGYDDHAYYDLNSPGYYSPPYRSTTLNNVPGPTFNSIGNYYCEDEEGLEQHHIISMDPANYNTGGLNTIEFGNIFTAIALFSDPDVFPSGVYARVCVEYDACDSSVEAPIIDTPCPSAITLCGAQNVTWTPPTATDNCDVPTVTNNYDSGDYFSVGTHTVTYTFEDLAGLTATCSFDVVINPLPNFLISQLRLPNFCQGMGKLSIKLLNPGDLTMPLTYAWSHGLGNGMEAEIALNNTTYSCTITDANGCSTTVSHYFTVDPSDFLSAYVILTEEGVDFSSSAVYSGGVGLLDDDEEVRVHNNSHIYTFLESPIANIDGSSSVANHNPVLSNVTLPSFSNNTYNDANDITVGAGMTMTLSSDHYGNIRVMTGGTLIFDHPAIFVKNLAAAKNANIEFAQATNLMVKKDIRLYSNNNFNVAGEDVICYVGDEVKISYGSVVVADIYAKEGLAVNEEGASQTTYMYGLFISEDGVESGDNVIWDWNFGCATPAPPPAPLAEQVNTTAKESPASKNNLTVFPNPAKGVFNITLDAFQGQAIDIVIYNTLGKIVWQQDMTEVDVSQIEVNLTKSVATAGIYFISVTAQDGLTTQSIIIE